MVHSGCREIIIIILSEFVKKINFVPVGKPGDKVDFFWIFYQCYAVVVCFSVRCFSDSRATASISLMRFS